MQVDRALREAEHLDPKHEQLGRLPVPMKRDGRVVRKRGRSGANVQLSMIHDDGLGLEVQARVRERRAQLETGRAPRIGHRHLEHPPVT